MATTTNGIATRTEAVTKIGGSRYPVGDEAAMLATKSWINSYGEGDDL